MRSIWNCIAKWGGMREYMVSALVVFLVSLLIFAAAMPQFAVYLTILCSIEWICILLYRRRDNRQFFLRIFCIGLGNGLAFTLQWILLGRDISRSNLDGLENFLLVLLSAGALVVGFNILARQPKAGNSGETEAPRLLPERSHDLSRLEGLLESGTPLIGVDARWGDGKTFLMDRLCVSPQVQECYEVVRINVLAGNEDEIERTLMNEFDRILRRNRIFSLASKQMLKLLEENDILKQLQWLLIEDTQSVSTTFSTVLSDLEKLGKKVLIVVDDIERLGDDALIRKLFALMESVSSHKVQIVYLFNSSMLTGFDRTYLEKYIPCYMSLTPMRFESIVGALWDELQMDTAGIARKDVEGLEQFPSGSYSIMSILGFETPGELFSFRLDNVTVRKVRVFLEEFRNLVRQKSGPDGGAVPVFPKAERELLLKCLFIKHFLSDDFEKLVIGADIADSFRFQLSREVKAALGELDPRVPDNVTLLYLFNVRRQLHGAGEMRNIMEAILEDSGNYNRLVALSMLEFDYTDIWRDIQAVEQPGARQGPAESAANDNRLNSLMVRAEQIGNEDISSIGRERNNERINRVMWNLLANGSSELANLDAYVRHFQELVLAAAPENRQAAWESFLLDGYHGRIYKDNVTRNRLSVDMYLPLFQGFRVTGASSEQWLKLLDFYFRSEEGAAITAEMLQNLNYVDITDHRVYLCVLNRFSQCGIIGNLNSEPCMYQFLRQTLRMAFTLGYTKQFLFHDLWYLPDEPAEFGGLMPSKQWKDAVLGMAKELDAMKRGLERDRKDDPRLSWFNAGIDAIIAFIDKCGELIAAERSIGMRTPNVKVKEARTVSPHEDLCNTLQEQFRAGIDLNEWYEKVHSAFDRGELDPSEVRKLVAQAEEQPV